MRRNRRLVGLLGLSVLGLVVGTQAFTGCAMPPGGNTVVMQNIAFSPATIRVKVGELVTWRNREGLPIDHTVTSGNPGDDDAGALFNSPTIRPGETFSHTFEEVGTFVYFCELHPTEMRNAIVIVEEE